MIFVHLDLESFMSLNDIEDKVKSAARDAIKDIAAQSYSHIQEKVQNNLHSSRQKYLDELKIEQVNDDVWMISLGPKAMWIEEGIQPNKEMIDDILKSPKAKRAKDGSKYLAVPFKHNNAPTASTPAQNSLTDTIKAEFKKRKIPYGKLETDTAGNPKKGLLHSFDMNEIKTPKRTGNGPGQGHGPIGEPKQGKTGTPFLQGLRVYQHDVENPVTKKMSTKKSIMTFRIVSTNQKGKGMWVHPGFDAKRFLDDAADWAIEQVEKQIKEKIVNSVIGSL